MSESDTKAYLFEKGNPSPLDSAYIPIFSHAIQYGLGIFEIMRVYSSVIPFFEEHLQKARNAAEKIGMKINPTQEEITEAVYRTIDAEGMQKGTMKILFPGEGDSFEANKFAVICARKLSFDEKSYEKGIRALTLDRKKSSVSRLAGVKTCNHLENLLAYREAKEKGFDEAILLNEKGNICECTSSNLFFIKGKIIYTPSLKQGIFAEVTRDKVIKVALRERFKIYEGKIRTSRIKDVDEVFMTSSLAEVISIVEIGTMKIGKGIPGAKTQRLHALYKNMLEEEILRIKTSLRSRA